MSYTACYALFVFPDFKRCSSLSTKARLHDGGVLSGTREHIPLTSRIEAHLVLRSAKLSYEEPLRGSNDHKHLGNVELDNREKGKVIQMENLHGISRASQRNWKQRNKPSVKDSVHFEVHEQLWPRRLEESRRGSWRQACKFGRRYYIDRQNWPHAQFWSPSNWSDRPLGFIYHDLATCSSSLQPLWQEWACLARTSCVRLNRLTPLQIFGKASEVEPTEKRLILILVRNERVVFGVKLRWKSFKPWLHASYEDDYHARGCGE